MIRLAQKSDSGEIVSLLRDCNLYNPELNYSEWSYPTLVTEVDGHIVGVCQFLLAKPYAYFSEIAVHPDYRRCGYAKSMVREMESILKEHGISACGWFIHEDNPSNLTPHGGQLMGRGYAYMKVYTDVA